jgi:hypothetical protein
MPKIWYKIMSWVSLASLFLNTFIFIMLVYYNMVREVVLCLATMVACGVLFIISCWQLSKFERIESTESTQPKAEADKDL